MTALIDSRPSGVTVAVRPLVSQAAPITHKPRFYDRVKRLLDFGCAVLGLIVSAPIICLAGLLVKLTSRGPIVYTQVRVGRDGRPFDILKLRTMYHNCEALSGPQWSTRGDRRITPIGRVLRKLHIDELPQLWNVLRGEMSMVGPRPERPEFVATLEQALPGYRERLWVKPGVTGLAQIQLPPDTSIESVREKLVLDRRYVECYSLWLDCRLILGTILYLLGVSYAGVRRLLALPGPAKIDTLEPSLDTV